MNTADSNNTPSRRCALGFGLAAVIGRLTLKSTRAAALSDRKLLAQLAALSAVDDEIDVVLASRHSIADEVRTEPLLIPLYEKKEAIEVLIVDAPQTLAGAQAMAQALIRRWPTCDHDGEHFAEDVDAWFAITIAEFLVAMPA